MANIDLVWEIAGFLFVILLNAFLLMVSRKRKEIGFTVVIGLWMILWFLGIATFGNYAAFAYLIYLIIVIPIEKRKKKKLDHIYK